MWQTEWRSNSLSNRTFPFGEKIKRSEKEESDSAQLSWRFSLVAFPKLTSQNSRRNAISVATFSRILLIIKKMAEEEGFEPPIPFQVRQFSRLEPSTTRPLFLFEV